MYVCANTGDKTVHHYSTASTVVVYRLQPTVQGIINNGIFIYADNDFEVELSMT